MSSNNLLVANGFEFVYDHKKQVVVFVWRAGSKDVSGLEFPVCAFEQAIADLRVQQQKAKASKPKPVD